MQRTAKLLITLSLAVLIITPSVHCAPAAPIVKLQQQVEKGLSECELYEILEQFQTRTNIIKTLLLDFIKGDLKNPEDPRSPRVYKKSHKLYLAEMKEALREFRIHVINPIEQYKNAASDAEVAAKIGRIEAKVVKIQTVLEGVQGLFEKLNSTELADLFILLARLSEIEAPKYLPAELANYGPFEYKAALEKRYACAKKKDINES
ncbi:MAG TPA: hypothetical protein VFF04_00985 [Candidatus Babeliales bacterium]|nr:hypothetical protein [Candidatus Babeliales bacterium]